MTRKLIIGTRGSALALRQVDIVEAALSAAYPGIVIERRIVRTEGDRRTDVTLEQLGGQGIFVKDIERMVLAGDVDAAVHSLKDMPATSPAGLRIAAVLPRADVRDVLISREQMRLDQLPPGARIGTGSRRRAAQLLLLRPDLRPTDIRGNVETRIRKVDAGEVDAVVLAAAGIERLGLGGRVSQIFSIDEMVPAAGQAVLAIQCRDDDQETINLLRAIDDAPTHQAITAERAYLARLGAGCRLPVGAYATVDGAGLHLRALIASDSGMVYRAETAGRATEAADLGARLAEHLAAEAGLTLEAMPR